MVIMKRTIPIIRIFDEEKAKEFYIDFLEFKCDWEHRIEPGMPLRLKSKVLSLTILMINAIKNKFS